MVGEPKVEEVLFHELTDPGQVRIVSLLVEHRAAVARVATCSARGGGCEEQLRATPLLVCQGMVVSSEELIPWRVASDHRSHEGRRRPQDSYIVNQQIQVALGVGLSCLLRKCVPEKLHEGPDFLKCGRLVQPEFVVQHPVRVQQQQRHVFLRPMAEGIQGAGRCIGLARESALQEAIVERGTDHGWRIAPHAVQGVQSTGCEELKRVRGNGT